MPAPFPISTSSLTRYVNPTVHALFTLQYLQSLSDISSFLPSTSVFLGFFTFFSTISPPSSSDASILGTTRLWLPWFSNLLIWTWRCCFFHLAQEKIPRCHPRERWISQHLSLSSITQISARGKFWRSILIWAGKEHSHSSLLVTWECFWKLLC